MIFTSLQHKKKTGTKIIFRKISQIVCSCGARTCSLEDFSCKTVNDDDDFEMLDVRCVCYGFLYFYVFYIKTIQVLVETET